MSLPRYPLDPDDDVDTCVFVRAAPTAWDPARVLSDLRELVWSESDDPKPMRQLAPAVRQAPRQASPWPSRRLPPFPRTSENVFLMPPRVTDPPPPWATVPKEPPSGLYPRTRPAPRRSLMHWLVFAMCFGIAFGISRDQTLRAELASDLRATPARVVAAVHALAR